MHTVLITLKHLLRMKLTRRRGPLMKGPGHLRQVMPSPSGVSLEMQGDVGGITAGRDNKKIPAILDVVSMKPMDMFL